MLSSHVSPQAPDPRRLPFPSRETTFTAADGVESYPIGAADKDQCGAVAAGLNGLVRDVVGTDELICDPRGLGDSIYPFATSAVKCKSVSCLDYTTLHLPPHPQQPTATCQTPGSTGFCGFVMFSN